MTTAPVKNPGAAEILELAAQHIRDRAALRDTPEGERSMAKNRRSVQTRCSART